MRRNPLSSTVSPRAHAALVATFFILFFGLWAFVTIGGYVRPLFLADPVTTFAAGVRLFIEHGFLGDIGITLFRVVGGFVLATIIGVPIGIAMGASRLVEAFLGPFISFARYLPASAFIPLLILWVGVGEAQKLSVIFIGSVFQIILMVAVIISETRRDLMEAAVTLGAGRQGVVLRVMLPNAAPAIAEVLRLVLGWAWTYVIVAELVGADSGIGHMIMDSQRFLDTGQMIFGIFIIGVIGMVSDLAFRGLNRRLFPWYRGR